MATQTRLLDGPRSAIEQHWLRAEVGFAAIATIGVWLLLGDGSGGTALGDLLGSSRAVLYGTLAGLAGALLGFVLAAGSIIAPMIESPWMVRIKESNQHGPMWSMFLSATRGLGLLTVVSLLALVLDPDGSSAGYLALAVLFLALLSMLQVGTCVWILESVVRILGKQQATSEAVRPKSPDAVGGQ